MVRLPFGLRRGPRGDLAGFFGKLEARVLEALWRRGTATSVRDLHPEFPSIAYTTLMTTLDRLHRKGVLARMKAGRAFRYRPRYSRDELRVSLAEDALAAIFGPGVPARPLLSFLLEAASRSDDAVLDELERLVRERRGIATEASPPRRGR